MEPKKITEQSWSLNTAQLVSIAVVTFNHESYIKKTIDGFLMQKTTFPIKITVFDDCSNDRTQQILKEYEEKHPQLFYITYAKENTYKKAIREEVMQPRNDERDKAKYIAICEGDDYWTDPLKLQKQVDFMEANPDYSLTTSGFEINRDGKVETSIKSGHPTFINEDKKGFTYTLETKGGWLTKTLTAVYRNNKTVLEAIRKYRYSRDVHLFYHLLKEGKGYYFKEVFGVYNIHDGGVYSLNSQRKKDVDHFYLYRELYEINQDEHSREKYMLYLKRYLNHLSSDTNNELKEKKWNLIKAGWQIAKTKSERKSIIRLAFPKKIKAIYRKIKG